MRPSGCVRLARRKNSQDAVCSTPFVEASFHLCQRNFVRSNDFDGIGELNSVRSMNKKIINVSMYQWDAIVGYIL